MQKNMGKVWKNPNKTEDKHPDLKGFVWIDGCKFDLGGWHRKDDQGRGYYSLSARLYEPPADNSGVEKTVGRKTVQTGGPSDHGSAHDLNDEVPF